MQNPIRNIASRFKAMMVTMPYKVGVLMVSFSKDRFKYQNWVDIYPEQWKPRSRRKPWTNKGKSTNNQGRAILTQSGRLRRSIRIVNTTAQSVTIGSDVPYAGIHNNGGMVTGTQRVRAYVRMNRKRDQFSTPKGRRKPTKTASGVSYVKEHTRQMNYRMPRRRFMGESKYLMTQITRLITAEVNKLFYE